MINETALSNVMKNIQTAVERGPKRTWPRVARHAIMGGIMLMATVGTAFAQLAVSTLAGSSPAIQSGSADGTGTAASFNSPSSVAVDSSGNIYVADANNHKIRKVTPTGVVTTLAGSGAVGSANGTGAAATFNFPQGVATDGTNVYVADTFNHVIRQIVISSGVTTTLAGTAGTFGTTDGTGAAALFRNPLALTYVSSVPAALYVADTSNHTIRKIVVGTGVVTTIAGTAGTSGSADATGVAATFKSPGGIASEGTTNLYVADTGNNTIRKIVISSGVVTTFAGTAGSGGSVDATGSVASFKSPNQLVVSGANLFVADTANNTIRQIVVSTAAVTTVAGSAGLSGGADALGTSARFNGLTGIGASSGGTLFIADTTNHRIRSAGASAAPTVTSPASVSVTQGANPTFTVAVTGNPTPTIQWERQAANTSGFVALTANSTYSGVTSTTLTVSNVTLSMSGDQFRATVTNGVGGAVSSTTPATLTVQLAPAITSVASTSVALNTPLAFQFTATGSPAPTFSVVSGTFPPWASLSTAGVLSGTPTNSTGSPFTFVVQASNGVGTPATQSFTVTVQNGAAIATQPTSASTSLGGNASFSVVASGFPSTFTYQWYRNAGGVSGFTAMSDVAGTYFGTTAAFLQIFNVTQAMSGDQFFVVVSNGVGTPVSSSTVTLTVAVAPTITSANNTAFGPNIANQSFQVTATGSPAPTFSIASGTFPSWASLNTTTGLITVSGTIPNPDPSSPYNFVIQASNNVAPAAQQAFQLTVTPGGAFPAFSTQPGNVSVTLGQTATFTVVATGSPAPTLQWQRQTAAGGGFINLTEGGAYTGTTTATLTVVNASTGMNGDQFQCVATNTVNGSTTSATSNIATLNVTVGTIISTVAGTVGVSATKDGTGTAAQFTNPASVAVDPAGNIYVADPTAQVIRKITSTGVVSIFAGALNTSGTADGAGTAARFNGPSGVAVDGSGNVYVADTNNHTIRGISGTTGNVFTLAGTPGQAGSVDSNGSATPARFNFPFGVAVDTFGTVYVADTYNHMIRRVAANGTVSTMGGSAGIRGTADGGLGTSRFAYPIGITVDAQGFIYVADSQNNTIRKINQGNVVTTIAGTAGAAGTADGVALTVARFNQPNGVAVDSTGTVYVADTFSHTIRSIVTTNGVATVTTLAGLAGTQGSTDGTGAVARFSQPNSLSVDANGNLYIADTQNRTIRRSGAVTPPVITRQPVNTAVAPGGTATFSVAASGAPAPSVFSWQRKPADGSTDFVTLTETAPYSGTATAQLTITGVTAAMNGDQFRAVVSNFISPDPVSSAATLSTVVAPPVFTSVASATFKATQLGAVTIAATGNPTPTFSATGLPSWLSLDANSGVLSGTAPDTSGSPFTITITANNGVAVTQSFSLTVTPAVVAPAITTPPVGGTIALGQNANFSVTVTGTTPLTYQWFKDGVAVNGATNGTLTLTGVRAANAGFYTVTVSNSAGSATSVGTLLTINTPATIVTQPRSQTAQVGSSVQFTVVTAGSPAATYQWRSNGATIAGATNATLTLPSVQVVDTANYDVIYSNGVGGGVSSIAQLSVVAGASAPVITASPAARTLVVGSSTVLSVGVSASPAPTYQWRKSGVAIQGATGATLTLGNLQLADSLNYDVVVTNSAGSATSASAAVTVIRQSFAGYYSGSFGTNLGNFALYVRPDNSAVFLGYLPASLVALSNTALTVSDLGAFSVQQGAVSVQGTITPGTGAITGTVTGVNGAALTGAKSADFGSSLAVSGYYQGGAANTSSAMLAIVNPTGQAFILVQTSATSDGGQGAVDSTNRALVQTARQAITANFVPTAGTFTGTVVSQSATTAFSGATDVVLGTQRLANISTRARVGTGDAVTIAGFVVSGVESKPVLIRAIGPSLTGLGITTALTAPKLELFRSGSSTAIASNTGWTTGSSAVTSAIIAANNRAGAFALTANLADSAIVATLAPGAYTAVISSANNAPGVALAEVYDLSSPAAGQKLFNISTRASTGAGDATLIAGISVSGSAPKRLLIRGVGPTLTTLGVAGALSQPQLNIIKDGATVATNSNWTTSPDASAIAAASAQVGAFALGSTSADAAMIVSLPPGNYSAQVVGLNNTTGIAIIEVYELP